MKLYPFKALRPDPEKSARVASLPYDVVNRQEALALASGNPDSFLHVVRSEIDFPDSVSPYDERVYTQALDHLLTMEKKGVLLQDETPGFYVYRQIMNGREQYGLVCCVHAEDYYQGIIKKHELTRAQKEEDRLKHVLTTHCNTGPVFLTYRDEGQYEIFHKACTREPVVDFVAEDGIAHTIWLIQDAAEIAEIEQAFETLPCAYIADGHHRSAAGARAARVRAEANPQHQGDEEYNRFMAILFPAQQLHILDYNRVVKDLNGLTSQTLLEQIAQHCEVVPLDQAAVPGEIGCFHLYVEHRWYACTFKPEILKSQQSVIDQLDVAMLQKYVLTPLLGIQDPRTDDRIDFVGGIRGQAELEKRVDSGEMACAFAMHPTTIEQLMDIADAGEIMPPKSTWFEPKLRSGLLVHRLD